MESISDCDFFSTLNARVIPKKVNAAEIMNPARFISNTKEIMEPTTIRKATKSDLAITEPSLAPSGVAIFPRRICMINKIDKPSRKYPTI